MSKNGHSQHILMFQDIQELISWMFFYGVFNIFLIDWLSLPKIGKRVNEYVFISDNHANEADNEIN